MPVTLAHLIADTRTLSIPVGDDTLTVTYRPSGLTPATEGKLHELASAERAGGMLVTFLLDMLTGWDLLGEDGAPLPITDEVLSRLPLTFLARLVEALSGDVRADPTNGGPSAAT